jgi:hypothetical protein
LREGRHYLDRNRLEIAPSVWGSSLPSSTTICVIAAQLDNLFHAIALPYDQDDRDEQQAREYITGIA